MLKYIVKRLLAMIPVVIGVAILIFTIMYFVPGDPAEIILGASSTPETLAALHVKLGLNDPYIVRLVRFLSDTFLHFDLGTSYHVGTKVTGEIIARFPRTVILAVFSVIASALIGIPLGVTAAVHQNRLPDRICMFFSIIFFCIPQFWLALMLVILFSVKLGWLPAYGIGGIEYFIIPCLALMCEGFAMLARQTRSGMLEIIRSDYVITARSQGFSERDVIYKSALPNALIPVITVLGNQFARAIGGTIIIETVFSMPGLGLYMSTAIAQRDYPIIQGCVVFLAILFCVIMLLVDIFYAVVDPRIGAQFEGGGSRRKRRVREA
jgi:peptide/nickel transport system permease protein